ncbi:FISUMP domain-containing protein [Elizabethkingia meningoseptica]|uniref:FISUMP domain-containing protein n=1 Tax=Elizabethkingia meningoseptica TaxID=238 RepID=UPI000841285B|nr:FISUMP domain-containing protein [Elizabethkingia meningoseptica]ODM55407.1 hypothetical protein BES09_02880 [Elizabethkingia meningoseptica]OHT30614.1 hypothetical protein BFF93_02885 [Elizabethkingia meningoseptica]OPC15644.1 hypothetical protein BAX93_00990 [Elizabethkingia meningoseptica]
MRTIKFTQVLGISLPALLLWVAVSCRSSDTDNKILSNDPVAINVNMAHDDYQDIEDKNVQASSNQSLYFNNEPTQRRVVPFSGGFDLVAELKPDAPSLKNATQASLNPAAVATPIQRVIKFRVVVYNNATGQYDSSYIYSISATGAVTPDSGTPMKLNGGQNYDFIAYSYNTNVAPNENLTGSNLSSASLTITSPQDFMYWKGNMTPNGNLAQNNLNIVLKHSFSIITVNVDSSLTNGYNITNIAGATLGKSYPSASIALNSGAVTSSGTAGTVTVNFPASPNSSSVAATAAVAINNTTNTNDGTFKITTLTIGSLTGSNISFNNLTIQPGARYTMTMRVVPQDIFFDDTSSGSTIKVARINGKVWMRYNLGVNTTANPNPDLTTDTGTGLFGNYYQWGRSNIVANGSTSSGVISGWNTTSSPSSNNAWNSGSESNPVRTGNDPCPTNFRVPTTTEFQDLINSTIETNVNDWDGNFSNNLVSLKVFTSKKDKNVKLSFPAPGYRARTDGALTGRGANGLYWTSTPPSSSTHYSNVQLYKNNIDFINGADGPYYGENVRCIRVN